MDRLAAAAEAYCAAMLDPGHGLVGSRVEALATALAELYAAGRSLPPHPAVATPPPGPAARPDLGRFESTADGLSVADALQTVERWAWAGLLAAQDGDADRALAAWAGGWPEWSGQALLALVALHDAAERFRAAERPLARAKRGLPEVVSLVTGPARGQIGIRFEPLGIGVLVREVSADGPAAGLVLPGDVLLSADGRALDALDPKGVAALLVGAPGESKRVEVYRDGESVVVTLVAR